jgi:hypothetical protein
MMTETTAESKTYTSSHICMCRDRTDLHSRLPAKMQVLLSGFDAVLTQMIDCIDEIESASGMLGERASIAVSIPELSRSDDGIPVRQGQKVSITRDQVVGI